MEIAKWIVAFVAVMGFGGAIADYIAPKSAAQHIFNPAWPPHAKFHNAQAFISGALSGIIALVILFSFETLTFPLFLIAVAVSSVYWVAMMIAALVPNTDWTDPEFKGSWPEPLGMDINAAIGLTALSLLAAALIVALV